MSFGVVYCAMGRRHLDMAIRSYRSAVAYSKGLEATLVTDMDYKPMPGISVVRVPSDTPNRYIKTSIGTVSPYDKSLFLDADTLVVGDVTPMADLLDEYDFAACISQRSRLLYYSSQCLASHSLHKEYPHFSSGVFAFTKGISKQFFTTWLNNYKKSEALIRSDQLSFAATIRDMTRSGMRLLPLPSVWNVRPCWGDSVYGDIKVFHTQLMEKDPSLLYYTSNSIAEANKTLGPRWVKNTPEVEDHVDDKAQKLRSESLVKLINSELADGPITFVEIGVYRGLNAIRVLRGLAACGREVEYHGFDLFDTAVGLDLAEDNPRIHRVNVAHPEQQKRLLNTEGILRLLTSACSNVTLHRGDTRKTLLPALTAEALGGPNTLFYVDGGHTYGCVKADWEAIKAKAGTGSVVVFDDVEWDGVARLLREIAVAGTQVTSLDKWRSYVRV